jgi:NADP-dependent 3-hydroxy acid dehydrogenase YdfG
MHRMSRYPVRGKVSAITGAGSGIGCALAVELGR